jgi:hypothetical protein
VRNLRDLDQYRRRDRAVIEQYGFAGDETCGVFAVPSPIDGVMIVVVASCGGGWDHVSVSRKNRCPNWAETDHVKRMFFRADEAAMQLHVPAAEHISIHPHTLHLWRPHAAEIPRPPAEMV